MREQEKEQVATRAIRGFDPRGEEHPQERVDLLVVEALAVQLGGHQLGDEVVSRVDTPPVDDRGQVVPELAGALHGAVPVARHVDDADRPVLELLVVRFG